MLRLRGRAAHPRFRIRKLESVLRESLPALERVTTEFWHFVELNQDLPPEKEAVLRQLLDYGMRGGVDDTGGALFFVVPRLGTISPWSTKATDIARHCSLHEVARIERGVAWRLHLPGDRITADVEANLVKHLHDPMTESVVTDFNQCEDLFRHYEPRPLQTVDVLNVGAPALAGANQQWGMALSIVYCVVVVAGAVALRYLR